MRKPFLARLGILLMVFSLLLPALSLGAEGASEKVFQSRLHDVNYQFSDSYLSNLQNLQREAGKSDKGLENNFDGVRSFDGIFEIVGASQNGMNQSEKQIVPQNFVPISDSSKVISVIVELQAEPLGPFKAKIEKGLAKVNVNQEAIIQSEQKSFISVAQRELEVEVTHTYSHAFNGFALNIAANKVDKLLDLPGIKAIYEDYEVYATSTEGLVDQVGLNMDVSAPFIGADYFWNEGFTGQGIKVGVLDTGIDYHHPDLAGAYKGGWDFIDNDADPYETTPLDWENDPQKRPPVNERGHTFWTDHGTHVAGTVAGRGVVTGGVKGVAPEADIYAYRVLGPYGSGPNSGILAGIDKAVKDGMHVINLSLGGGTNNRYDAGSIALNNAMLSGVVVAVSAGNSGPGVGSLTDPASSDMAITVGNSFPPTEVPSLSIAGLDEITGTMMEFTPSLGDLVGETLEVVYVGLGEPDDFEGKDVEGKIAIMQRGNISFHDKSVNARDAGAAVAIIFNNAPGNFNGTMGEPGDYIPTFSLAEADGLLITNKIAAEGSIFAELGTTIESDYMNDLSSRGPAGPDYKLKPDIAAPGTGIMSSIPAYGKEDPDADYSGAYAAFTGTSMSAPHIAGAAALLLEKYGASPFEVKSMMMNSAEKISDRNGDRYRHLDQGAGRIDLVHVLSAKAVALVQDSTDAIPGREMTEYKTGSLTFGAVPAGSSHSRTIEVKDIVGESSSYSISTNWYGSAGGNLSTSADEVNVLAGRSDRFTFTIQIPSSQAEGYYEGELVLTENGGHELQIPISLYVGEAPETDPVTDLELDPDIFSPNGDGVQDTTDITFDLNETADYLSLDVYTWDLDWEGTVVEGGGLSPASYIVRDWDGVIDLWGWGIPWLLWDDIYIMIAWFAPVGGDMEPLVDTITPFIVDSEAPETSLNDPELVENQADKTGVISGTIDSDLLLDLIDADILLNPISQLFGAGVLYEENGDWVQVDGTVDNAGNFSITVPLKDGENEFEVYVYDAAGNGLVDPAHIVNYTFEDTGEAGPVNVTAKASKDKVDLNEVFAIDLNFSEVEDLYSAQFSLTYDPSTNKGSVSPSAELAAYQASQAGHGLIVNESVYELDNGLLRSDYIISLAGDFEGYSGVGSLASYNFSSNESGEYAFDVSNVRFLDSNGNDIEIGQLTGALVVVVDEEEPPVRDEFVISGNVVAQAFGNGVDYSEVWYSGDDGKHKVIVEARGEDGTLYHGTVSADGSYSIVVPEEGNYTITVIVPSHFGATKSVDVTNDLTVNFGPLTAGDLNGDGVIDLVDLQQAARAFGKTTPWSDARTSAADINRDGEVDMLDISFILNNYGLTK